LFLYMTRIIYRMMDWSAYWCFLFRGVIQIFCTEGGDEKVAIMPLLYSY
jgi:hypothetical protein